MNGSSNKNDNGNVGRRQRGVGFPEPCEIIVIDDSSSDEEMSHFENVQALHENTSTTNTSNTNLKANKDKDNKHQDTDDGDDDESRPFDESDEQEETRLSQMIVENLGIQTAADDGGGGSDDDSEVEFDQNHIQEEDELSQMLLDKIRHREDYDFFKKCQSQVSAVGNDRNDDDDRPYDWKTVLLTKIDLQQEIQASCDNEEECRKNFVSTVITTNQQPTVQTEVVDIDRRAPIEIEEDEGNSSWLFTRKDLQVLLIDRMDEELPRSEINRQVHKVCTSPSGSNAKPASGWSLVLTDSPDDPHTEVIQLTGTGSVRKKLKRELDKFLTAARNHHKFLSMLDDNDSIVFDLEIDLNSLDKVRLGITLMADLSFLPPSRCGIYIDNISPDGLVAKALGKYLRDHLSEFGGCLLSIDGSGVSKGSKVQQMVKRALHDFAATKEKRSDYNFKSHITFTLAMSKFADLDSLCRISAAKNVRRLDGTECHRSQYQEIRFKRLLKDIPRPTLPRMWVDSDNSVVPIHHATPTKIPITYDECFEAYVSLMEGTGSVEVDIVIPLTHDLGGDTHVYDRGVYFCNISDSSVFTKALGPKATKYGFVMHLIDGIKLDTPHKFDEKMQYNRERGLPFGATIVLYDGVDLCDLDVNFLYRRSLTKHHPYFLHGLKNPRRRQRPLEPYPLRISQQENCSALSPTTTYNNDDTDRDGKENQKIVETILPTFPLSDRSFSAEKDNGELGANVSGGNTSMQHLDEYMDFQNRYFNLTKVNYKDCGVNIRKFTSSMWKQHTVIFDNKPCHEHCPCIFRTKRLVENVFKDNEAANKQHDAGIFEHFAPRFVPKLRQEYPSETSSQLLTRIAFMWQKHQHDRVYGMKCGSQCTCEFEWEQQFGMGSEDKARVFQMNRKRTSQLRLQGNDRKPKIQKKFHVQTGESAMSLVSSEASNPLSQPQRGRNNSFAGPFPRFEAHFFTDKPLGAFFGNQKFGVNTTCKVLDICMNGQFATRPNILPQATVAAVVRADKRIEISSFLQLEYYYNEAKKKGWKLHLVFFNPHYRDTYRPTKGSQNWNANGDWTGPPEWCGWAGGARRTSSGVGHQNKRQITEHKEINHVVNANGMPNLPTRTASEQTNTVIRQESHFTESNDHDDDLSIEDPIYDESEKLALMKAVEEGTFYDVAGRLQSGICCDFLVAREGLKEAYDLCSRRLSKESDNIVRRELEQKKEILKIYINGVRSIEKATALQHWTTISIRIRAIEVNLKQPMADQVERSQLLEGIVRNRVVSAEQDICVFPLHIKTGSISCDSQIEFSVKNNRKVISETRGVTIAIIPSIVSFEFRLNEIEKQSANDGSWTSLSKTLDETDSCTKAIIEMDVRRAYLDKNSVVRKKAEAENNLKHVVTMMTKSMSLLNNVPIVNNVRSTDGSTLLHAAVCISDSSTDLIKALLQLGADPNCKNELNKSPITVARNFESRSVMKGKVLESSSAPSDQIENQHTQTRHFRSILDLFRK